MLIIGCDYHPGMQQIAWFDEHSGEGGEQRLEHSRGEAERFYRELKRRGAQVRWGSKPAGRRAGSSGCWRSWKWSCGSAILPSRGFAGRAPVRFARGVARETTGCVVEHRPFDSGAPLPSAEGSLQS